MASQTVRLLNSGKRQLTKFVNFVWKTRLSQSTRWVDTCAAEFDSETPYFYSTYGWENESIKSDKESVLVLGSGPIRIGQGVEFDYATVHSVKAIQAAGYEAIIMNSNPETVSTDFSVSDKLYFEPLTFEDVMNVIDLEQPKGYRSVRWSNSHQPCGSHWQKQV